MPDTSIALEQDFDASIDAVWKAITDEGQMQEWFFSQMQEFKPEVGFETRFNVNCEGKDYMHVWKVLEVVEGRRIAYSWNYQGYPGDSTVTWDLSPKGGGTHLSFVHDGKIEGDEMFTRENCEAGWVYLIQKNLKAFLDE